MKNLDFLIFHYFRLKKPIFLYVFGKILAPVLSMTIGEAGESGRAGAGLWDRSSSGAWLRGK